MLLAGSFLGRDVTSFPDELKCTDYLTNRQQRVKVNGSFSSWKDLARGVPQGSVLGPLLLNIYINDLLLFIQNSDICKYADDTTLSILAIRA